MSPSCLCCLLLLTLAVLGEEEDGQSRDGSHSVGESLAPRTQPEGHGAEGNETEQPEASQGTGGDTGGAGNPTPPKTPEEDLASAPRTQPESHGAEGPDSDHHGGNSPSTRGDKNRSQTPNKKKAGQQGISHGTRSGHPAPHNNHAPPAPHGSPGSPGYPAPPAPSAPESPGEGLEPGTQPGSPGAEENETEQTGNPQGSGGDTGGAGNPTPTVAPAQCRLSEIKGINGTAGEKEHYDPGESVSVWCSPGYYPNNMTMRCIGNGTSATWDDPIRCTEQCRKSALSLGTNVQLVPPQDYYLPNTGVSVRCPGGYKPSQDNITCKAEQDKSVWDVTAPIRCVAQCAKPTAPGIESVSNQRESNRDYYNRGEEVAVTCKKGYQSVSQIIRCKKTDKNGTRSNWNVSLPCIELCPKSALSLGTDVQLVPPQDYYLPNTGVSVRCPGGYKPSRDRITCKAEQNKSVWDVTAPILCVAQCAKPTAPGIESVSNQKDYYNRGEEVTVTCETGYQSVSRPITCKWNGTHSNWNVSAPCIEQCAKPTAQGVNSSSLKKHFYDVGESVTVTCARGYQSVSRAPGYQSVSGAITCETNGGRPNWNVSVPCIAFQVNVRRVTPTSISLQWECQPGPCRSYWSISVSYWPKGQKEKVIHTVTEGATVRGLEPHTEYIITIYGYRQGKWTELERRTIRTEESAPGKPDFTQDPSINNNTLKWRLLETHGVLTGYQLNISAHREYDITFSETESHWLGPNVTEFNMELKYGTNYTVTLRGFTVSGPGEPAVWAHETSIGEPPEPINKWIGVANQAAFFLLHSVPSQHGPISSYEIIIAQGWNGNLSQICTSYTSTLYNSSQVPTLYTAMLLPAENVTGSMNVTLGDGRNDGTFYNAPLRSDQNYTLYVRVTSTWKEVNKSSCTRFGPFLIEEKWPLPVPALIGGLAGGGALLLLVALLAFCGLVRSAKCRSPFGKSNGIPMSNRNERGRKKRDIPVDDLLEVVKRFRNEELLVTGGSDEENSSLLLVGRPKEYKELPSGPLYPCAAASSEQNRTKNRYKKVIPYDNSRVILRSDPSGSGYINASYIDGYRHPKFFIATQGPLPETVAHFWNMVWQENSSVIVMLTGLEEQNKVKCERYWPEETQTYGDIRVSVQSSTQTGALVTRSLALQKVGGTAQRTVEHLHYLQWPDHGVPNKPSGLLQLVEQMNECKLPGSGPVIVHCSAGIGRTGTLLALDILLKRARAEGKVNVYECTLQMRRKRLNMVQTQGQYVFLYDVLLETLVCGATSLPIGGVQSHVCKMAALDPVTKTSGFTKEFQAVEKLTELYKICSYREAQKPENHCKNLDSDIIPGDHCRPILMSVMDQHGAPGYINAVFVNSNSQEDLFIVTQLPNWETLADLWSLVWDYRCTAIVVMHSAQEIRELCPHFWPESGESTYSNFRLRKISSLRDSGFSGATLHLQHKKEPALEVQLWHLDSWPKDKPVPQDPGAIISLIGKVERLQNGESHVLVMCGDGATRSGVFCAGTVICDQIRSDGFLDVSQAVRSLKQRRSQLIPNVAQYSFCYSLAQSYLSSFETYGNFQ
ncbi:receptor-type tyrosine-protein phosphatase kappa-like isoform X2 [Xenopus tropicalis]|uniref:Tyrosine-protein phosphatase non-receptor type 20 n=1 Tax=Xenopus tropicalis TaxID=8364 RepID=A0A8J1J1H4_XENTR|nr:receptor-type tyrosine-protein phosphatase kappa-like isoform X2 [Xenopus tropicalis]